MLLQQKVEVCRRLYRLIFQLVLLFESYLKLLEVFRSVTTFPQVRPLCFSSRSTNLKV